MSNDKIQNNNVATVEVKNSKGETTMNAVLPQSINAAQDKPDTANVSEIRIMLSDIHTEAQKYGWKKHARGYMDKLVSLIKASYETDDTDKLEAMIENADTLLDNIRLVKATESDRVAFKVLWSEEGALVDSGEDEIPLENDGFAICRYSKNINGELLSVLFTQPLSANENGEIPLDPIGTISGSGVQRFTDVKLTAKVRKAMQKAKQQWCHAAKLADKLEKQAQTEELMNKAFNTHGFTKPRKRF